MILIYNYHFKQNTRISSTSQKRSDRIARNDNLMCSKDINYYSYQIDSIDNNHKCTFFIIFSSLLFLYTLFLVSRVYLTTGYGQVNSFSRSLDSTTKEREREENKKGKHSQRILNSSSLHSLFCTFSIRSDSKRRANSDIYLI